ncbi:hypothetical protein [Alkalilacustris brevis]|uniref:hypothetical protein n=1 Tax=Alkalilacustris brevis TaxID=2026338 RepID=UPI000E0DCECC|nr:hypothetical protein [Alkalilacustris brevis]
MKQDETLWRLEEALWTSGRDSARAETAADAIIVLPYPDGIMLGENAWTHPSVNTGWRLVEMMDRDISRHGAIAILAYRVRAEKPGNAIHEALCASTWHNDGGTWRRLAHQQTPTD